jgi:hypothetical protein
VQISQESAIQVIWRPDSQGFFMLEGQILYYVSVPMATRKVVDAHVDGKNIWYMWLNGK